jgi:methionyl-tRNA formyltransferase
LRTAYLGTSDFAATVLRALAESEHRPALVVTPPDRRRGRGQKVSSPPAADAARELGLELHQTASVNDPESAEALRAATPDVVAVCAFGQLIADPVLSEHRMLNVHPSLIPRWRGAAPIERAIMAGDERTGVTIMGVTSELDAGPVALQEEIPVAPSADFAGVSAELAVLSGKLLVRALDLERDGGLELSQQDEAEATYAEKIDPGERRLDPARPAAELARVVRALNPHIGTHLELQGGERLGVRAASAVSAGPNQSEIAVVDGVPVLGTSHGGLRLDVLQAPGGKPLGAEEFLRGNKLPSSVG